MSESEIFLAQLERLVAGIVGGVASAIVRRRMPSQATMLNWSNRLRKAADLIESHYK